MRQPNNNLGQPIGFAVSDWTPPLSPPKQNLNGKYCRLEPTDSERHSQALYQAFVKDTDGFNWTYLPYGPFQDFASFDIWLRGVANGDDPMFQTIVDLRAQTIVGIASYLRINPNDGVIEVGHIHYSPLMQRTTIATEAMYLMMKQVFELGYRRYEWKCDALNAPSRAAAMRLGFKFEGVFQQLTMYKGRNRDTAWFAIIDKDWHAMQTAYQAWLSADNFDTAGKQLRSLSQFIL